MRPRLPARCPHRVALKKQKRLWLYIAGKRVSHEKQDVLTIWPEPDITGTEGAGLLYLTGNLHIFLKKSVRGVRIPAKKKSFQICARI